MNSLAWLDRCEPFQGSRDEWQQVFEAIGFGTEDDDCNFSGLEVLLVGYALIDPQQDVEPGSFGGREKVAIF